MIKKLFHSVHDEKELPELTQLTNEYNLKRIVYTAVFFLVYQLLNILDVAYPKKDLIISCTALIILCSLYILVIVFGYRKLLDAELGVPMSLLFWSLLMLGLTQYMLLDIHRSGTPLNAMMFCSLMVIVPIFTKRQSFFMFFGFFCYSMLVAILAHASALYFKYNLLICISSFALSLLTQQQFVHMILTLSAENRIDPLTGILNRRGGLDQIETLLELCKRHGRAIALYMIDIDFFKQLNDAIGHLEADTALREVARAMDEAFERRTDIICRYGGDEFLACCSIFRKEDAKIMADKLLKAVANAGIATPYQKIAKHLTISIGYTVYTPPQSNVGIGKNHYALILEADQALYGAKADGRNNAVLFSPLSGKTGYKTEHFQEASADR